MSKCLDCPGGGWRDSGHPDQPYRCLTCNPEGDDLKYTFGTQKHKGTLTVDLDLSNTRGGNATAKLLVERGGVVDNVAVEIEIDRLTFRGTDGIEISGRMTPVPPPKITSTCVHCGSYIERTPYGWGDLSRSSTLCWRNLICADHEPRLGANLQPVPWA